MANWTGGRLTKAGNDLQTKVEAGLCKLELTKIKLGDGTEGLDATDNLTDLVGPKAVFGISSVVAKDGMCTVTGIISSSQVTAAFYAREWGLFAKDPDRGEILYMISLDPNPESIPPKTAALKQAATYAMNIVVSNAANITAHIDPAGLVTIAILEEYLRRVVGKTDGKLTETLDFANDVGTILRGFMAGDDRFRIYAGRKNHNEGYIEIATADDGTEAIVVRQYADQEFKTLVREAKLLDEQGNTSFPGRVSATGGFAGTADNATRLEGKNLAEIKDFVLEIAAKSFDSKVSKTGDKLTGALDFANDIGTIIKGLMGKSDSFRIYAGSTGDENGYLEIATADDGTEAIVVRQYGDLGFKTLVREAKLLDEQGNTSFPGRVSATGGFAGTADNALRLGGKNFAEVKDAILEIMTKSIELKVSKTGDKLTGALDFENDIGTILKGLMGKSDAFRIYAGSTGEENGYFEIATADDGSEPILLRQYGDQDFQNIVREAKLLDEQGNTSFPGRVSAAEGFAGTADSAKEAALANGVSAAVTNHFYRHIGGYETPTITALVDWQLMTIENNGTDPRSIRNAESGVVACDGENTSKSGYGKGCILLKRVYTDFDKILALACDATGRTCFRQVFDKWELDLMFANSLVFDLARSQSEYWRIMGGKKGTYPGELSYGTVWRTHSKNCGIVEIYGIKH